jgi:hypothetical protein
MVEFKNAKYVCGVNMVGVGFDISTFCEGQQFTLGAVFRKLSDKISQPLSKNPDHELHKSISANILQAMARLRKGGRFIIPPEIKIDSLYDALCDLEH